MTASVTVRRLTAPGPDRDRALHLVLDAPYQPGEPPAAPVAELLSNARRQSLDTSLLIGVFRGRQMVSACLALESPGQAALVFLPTFARHRDAEEAEVEGVRAAVSAAGERNLRILQALLPSEASGTARALSRAGFQFLTRLVYLERPLSRPAATVTPSMPLRWVQYAPEHDDLFLAALEASYAQTLDCAKLVGLRSTREVLAGHRATGEHDPSLWWVALGADSAPVGVLLLTRLPGRGALEVVYLGVAQPCRGQGIGDALVGCALRCGRACSASAVALAVDEANTPARRLYERWGFTRVGVRDAWITTPHGA